MMHVLLILSCLAVAACSDHSQEEEYNELKQRYIMLPFTDIERETGGLDSLFVVYDSLQKPLEDFIARYAEGDMVSDATAWRNRIQMRKKYWQDIRDEFYRRVPTDVRNPATPAEYCQALQLVDTLRNELQYKEPVIMDVLSRDLAVIERRLKQNRTDLLRAYLTRDMRSIKSTLRNGVADYARRRNSGEQVDGVYEVSSQTFAGDSTVQLDVVYSVALARKNFLVFKKTEMKQYRATAQISADCGEERYVTYSYAPANSSTQ